MKDCFCLSFKNYIQIVFLFSLQRGQITPKLEIIPKERNWKRIELKRVTMRVKEKGKKERKYISEYENQAFLGRAKEVMNRRK